MKFSMWQTSAENGCSVARGFGTAADYGIPDAPAVAFAPPIMVDAMQFMAFARPSMAWRTG